MKLATAILVSGMFVSAAGFAQQLPDPKLTPGATIPTVTLQQVCHPGYSSGVRNVPSSEKRQVYERYGIAPHTAYCTGKGCEVDHLISLELGGSNDISNLWPQPYEGIEYNAHVKDKLENELHRRVCAHQMELHDAQLMIRTNWIEAYKQVFADEPVPDANPDLSPIGVEK